jgi:hypothetical protein
MVAAMITRLSWLVADLFDTGECVGPGVNVLLLFALEKADEPENTGLTIAMGPLVLSEGLTRLGEDGWLELMSASDIT